MVPIRPSQKKPYPRCEQQGLGGVWRSPDLPPSDCRRSPLPPATPFRAWRTHGSLPRRKPFPSQARCERRLQESKGEHPNPHCVDSSLFSPPSESYSKSGVRHLSLCQDRCLLGASRARLEMGGMRKRDLLLAREDPLGEVDEDIPNEKDSESQFESDSDSEPEEVPLDEPSKKAIYNREGILEKLEDISWPENVEWIHKLTIDHNEEQEIDVNDDIVRELAFYTQALEGTRQAFAKIQSLGVPFFRPPDYYAEMVKTDSHMLKVKGRLLEEKKKIEEAEERKKAREAKKIAKEVQAQKLKERAKQKKEDIESVKKWRKQRQQNGFRAGKDEEMDFAFDGERRFESSKKRKQGVAPGDRSGGKQGSRGQERGKKRRENRNSKFGHGGRKGLKKQNTAESTDDLRGFNKGDFSAHKRRKR